MRHSYKSFAGVLVALAAGASSADAAILAQWTFETNTPADVTDNTDISGIAADVGTGTASGHHAGSATDWTTPAGNGSANSLSANTWTVGDYYQFQTSTTGAAALSLTFDQTGSGTGPRDFKIQYSTDGSNFTDLSSYVLLVNGAPNPAWNGTTSSSLYTTAVDLSSISALLNQPAIYIRLTDNSTTSLNGGTVAAGGTSRVDNVTITDQPIPEPASLALLGAAGLLPLRRRRA